MAPHILTKRKKDAGLIRILLSFGPCRHLWPTVAAAPCDLYASGGTPCVAAHSPTRSLYNSFTGALYQILRNSDGSTLDVYPLSGGVANVSPQDQFCLNSTCSIAVIYDQSGHGNDLTRAPPNNFNGPQSDGYDNLANPVGASVTLNGQKAYGVFISLGTGYRNNECQGTATGDEPEGIYAVLDGTHYNDNCCFDYGNAENKTGAAGLGNMEAIYCGNCSIWDTGAGPGPWIMADMEVGLFSSGDGSNNPSDPTQTDRFVTAMVKCTHNLWAIRGGNSESGALSTYWSGVRPSGGYNPMRKEGDIILGIAGDNSNGAQGTFYEGVMTTGYPSDDTENAVQENIVAADYAVGQYNNGQELTVGSSISFHVTTPGFTTSYIAHNGTTVNTQVVSSSSPTAQQQTASWVVEKGLGNSNCFSFESVDTPGSYIYESDFHLMLGSLDGTLAFGESATFCIQAPLNGQGSSIRSWSYPARYFRHYGDVGYIAGQGGPEFFDATNYYSDDVSFIIGQAFA